MNQYLLLLFTLFFAQAITAQSLVINGNIVIGDSSPENSKIIIFKNNEKIDEQVISKKGHFEFKLSLDADYKISFEKDGYISKIVNVNTEVPSEIVETNPNFPPVKLIINLLPKVESVDLSIFEQPIAILAYDHELDDFTFDKEYSDKIKDRVAQTEKEIKRFLLEQGSKAEEKERIFKDLVEKGQAGFDNRSWTVAIDNWTKALSLKPEHRELNPKIEAARKELEQENARKKLDIENARKFKLLVFAGDSLFNAQKYNEAKGKYSAAGQLNGKDPYPPKRIAEINVLLESMAAQQKKNAEMAALMAQYKKIIIQADQMFGGENYDEAEKFYREALALNYEKEYPAKQIQLITEKKRQKAEAEKKTADTDANYKKAITAADNAFASKDYSNAITWYRQAITVKPTEAYPKEMLTKAELALKELTERLAAEKERKEKEMARKGLLKNDYEKLITEADQAFAIENYSLAKLRYTEADNLNLGEEHPKKRLKEIEVIFSSSKYQARLAEYNQNKALGDKSLEEKNYASAKFYYQKALSILPINQEIITKQIAEIDKLIEAEHHAEIEKNYKIQIDKADKAYKDKAYAVAKFYYQKALEVKKKDKYALDQLEEVGKYINERQEKEAEL